MSEPDLKIIKRTKVELDTLIALAGSDTVTEAAKRLGVSRFTIYERISKYGLADQLKDIQQVAMTELVTGASKAARNLVSKIDHQDPDVSVKSSTEILDRLGMTKPTTNEGGVVNNNYGVVISQQKDKYNL